MAPSATTSPRNRLKLFLAACHCFGVLPNKALQRTAATGLVCQGVKSQRLPRLLSLDVRRRRSGLILSRKELEVEVAL